MDSGTGLHLDAATLLFSISMLTLFMSAATFGMARGIRQQGLEEWGRAMLCGAGAFLLFYLRQYTSAPWAVTYLVANILIFGTAAYCLLACARLLELRPPYRVVAVCTALGMSGVIAVYFLGMPHRLSIFTLSLGVALEFGYAARMVKLHAPVHLRSTARVVSAAMGLIGLALVFRAIYSLFGSAATLMPAASTSPQLAVLLVAALFFALSTTAFIILVNERQAHETFNRLRRDGLTGLYTRTAFFEMVEGIDQDTKNKDYAVVMLDIDHFKSINDRYGHAGGDAALAHAARLIAGSIRITDIAVRYGGEEFCVLLKNCTENDAAQLAQRLVSEAGQQQVRLRDGRNLSFTFSAGYAARQTEDVVVPYPESLEEMIQRADEALYRAKNSGRNQAVAADALMARNLLVT